MLRNDTVQISLCGKKVFSVLVFFIAVLMFFSQIASAASWSHYDSGRDAIVFDYTDAVDYINANNFYMEVTFVKNNVVNVRRFTSLSGYYYATENGFHTVRFYKPDGTQYLTNYQSSITQIENGTWNDGAGYFGYDGTTGNIGVDPDGGGSAPNPPDDGINPGTIINNYYYDPSIDQYVVKFSPAGVRSIYIGFHGIENYDYGSEITNERTFAGLNFNGDFFLTCNGLYIMKFYNQYGGLIEQQYFETYQMIDPICNSSAANGEVYEPTPDDPPPPPPPPKTEETFNYGTAVGDWINGDGYMNVTYTDPYGNNHGTKSYRNLSGGYDMTANGTYTFEFFNSDGSRYAGPITRSVYDIDIDTIETGQGYFGKDQSGDIGDNKGCDCWFQAPAWNEYMGKLDEIKNAIPPPPNWNAVADTFYDRIVPRAINDLRNMLGTAPTPPSSPAIIQPINQPTPSRPAILDYADRLEQNTPQMTSNPALDNATFTADDVKSQAPEIEFREDESGGFDLPSSNPVDSLPELPFEDFPMPGMESAGEWDHQPIIGDNPFPMPSENSSGGGSLDPGVPPIPNESGNEAPLPGQEYNAPTPSGVEINFGNYKKHPDDPDGSG